MLELVVDPDQRDLVLLRTLELIVPTVQGPNLDLRANLART